MLRPLQPRLNFVILMKSHVFPINIDLRNAKEVASPGELSKKTLEKLEDDEIT